MFPLMDGVFLKRRCYLKLGDGTILNFVRLRADCFFRYWSFVAEGIDEEGYAQAIACPPPWSTSPTAKVSLRIDPLTSLLFEFSYLDNECLRVFRLEGSEYHEQVVDHAGGDQASS